MSRFLLPLSDVAIALAGIPVAHKMATDAWLPASPSDLLFPCVAALLYPLVLGVGHHHNNPPLVDEPALRRLGVLLVGIWGSVFTVSIWFPSSVFSPAVLGIHGLFTVSGLLGSRLFLSHSVMTEPSSPRSTDSSLSVSLDDLVPREPAAINRPALQRHLSSQTILVTGAGGSIGSELSTQLLTLAPARIVLVDVSEQNLHQLDLQLRPRSSETEVSFVLADVRNGARMEEVLAQEQPDLVFHTAAYKHVHLMEHHPVEAFQNNSRATADLLQCCERNGVNQFVFVSTDKAVQPQSVLGATKQRAEWYVQTARSPVQAYTVRFGNVFGSTGSVVPRFERKLARGEPLPVTHPEMERYFMTTEEAGQLLLETLLLDRFPTYILRMGDPIRIQWLAEQMIERWDPHVPPDDMIEYTGRRPGEKLSEQLVRMDESVHDTEHANILGLETSISYSRERLDAHLRHVQSVCASASADRQQIRRLLLDSEPIVPAPST